MKYLSTNKKGFSLIELLVVMAIIAIVASIAFTFLSNTASKGNDTERISDLRQIQNALQLYFVDYRGFPSTLAPLVTAGFIPEVPTDPVGDVPYSYKGQNGNADCATSVCRNFHLGAPLELENIVLSNDSDHTSLGSGAFAGTDSAKCNTLHAGVFCYDIFR